MEAYGPLAQFNTSQRLLGCLRDGTDIVQADLAQINAESLKGYHPCSRG